MPTYDYECSACGHKYELYQSITAEPEKKCPACGKKKAKRLIGSGGTIIFKGSGFYATDYRSENYKKGAKAEADAVAGGKKEKSEAAKPETKSEPTSTPKGSTSEGKNEK